MSEQAFARSRDAERISVGPYRRVVAASLERVWENVLDWEHLPHLHHDSFAAVRLISADADGWRAMVSLAAELGGGEAEIEVRLDRPQLRYATRTLAGTGAGTEIVTFLGPASENRTRIVVDFRVPGIAPEQIASVGGTYRRLYARLWDQDEAMMTERQRYVDGAPARREAARGDKMRAPVPLGDATLLRSRLPLFVEVAGRVYRIVEVDGAIVVHSTTCPHRGGPLGAGDVRGGRVTCPWHGYRFDVRSGLCADARGLTLAPAPSVVVDASSGEATLRWGEGGDPCPTI